MSESERIIREYDRRSETIPGDRYAPVLPGPLFIRQGIERALARTLRESGLVPLDGARILDVGCGTGQWLADLETFGADRSRLAGVDLVSARADAAAMRLHGADIRQGDATALPHPDGTFDLVVQSMMLSSVLDAGVREAIAAEMVRVLVPGGTVLSYDFFVDNPRNPSVTGIGRGEVRRLFPGFAVHWRRATLAPPLVRLLAPRARPLAGALEAIPLLRTHALAWLRRP